MENITTCFSDKCYWIKKSC